MGLILFLLDSISVRRLLFQRHMSNAEIPNIIINISLTYVFDGALDVKAVRLNKSEVIFNSIIDLK